MGDINKLIDWFRYRINGGGHEVGYSMEQRNGPVYYDCSSSVYFALIEAGFLPQGHRIGNTDTLFGDLEAEGWQRIPLDASGSASVPAGSIFIWGKRGASGGSFGHTGVFEDSADTILHCNYANDGISRNNHDDFWVLAGCPEYAFYAPPAPMREEVHQVESRPVNAMTYDELKRAVKDALREGTA